MKKNCVLVIAVSLGAGWAFAQQQPAAVLKGAYDIRAGGAAHRYELALDEVSVKDSQGRRRVRKVAAKNGATTLSAIRSERARSRADVSPVLYERGKPRSEFTRAHVTRKILVKLGNGIRAADIASAAGLRLDDSPAYAPDLAVLEAGSAEEALAAMEKLRGLAGVLSADVLLARQKQKSQAVDDAYYPDQWNFHNMTQKNGALSIDINVEPAWSAFPTPINGSGITIGILDDGLQHAHPDLQPNYNAALSFDFNGNDADPNPELFDDGDPQTVDFIDPHGTACAGLAAARGDNAIGVSGVAYLAGLAGIRIVAAPTTDQDEANAFSWRNDAIHVKSSSWNVHNDGLTLAGPDPLAKAALVNGVAAGRGGKGTIYVVSGGNGLVNQDNSNYDGYANAIQVIAVGAINDYGFQSFYSEPGANLAVCAPSNGGLHNAFIATTDLVGADGYNDADTAGVTDFADPNYTGGGDGFGGSSAACPQVAGVAALLLQANSTLGWRDVKEILMRSARPVHASDPDWLTNGAGLHFNHKYGAGLVDAGAAVALAKSWTNLPVVITAQLPASQPAAETIPDNNSTGVTRTYNFTNTNFRVEHVEVTVNIAHPRRGDLEIILTSPSGMTSRLAEVHRVDSAVEDYPSWTFTTVRHWGETALGNWTVTVADREPDPTWPLTVPPIPWTRTLNSVVVKLHGSTNAGARIAGSSASLAGDIPVESRESNLPSNSAADPGETVTFDFGLKNIAATATPAGLTATLLPMGGVTQPFAVIGGVVQANAVQTFTPSLAAGATVLKRFTFRTNGSSGTMVKAILQIKNGATLLGYASLAIPLGKITSGQLSTSSGAVSLPDLSVGSPSPSSVTVSNLTGRVHNMRLHINSLIHSYPDDLGLLLQGPDDLQMQVFRGGPSGPHGLLPEIVNYTFDGNAPVPMPYSGHVSTGTYKPFDQYQSSRSMTQDPGDSAALTLGEFNGVPANGSWNLYSQDFDSSPGSPVGSIGSWQLNFTTMDCTDNVLFSQAAATVAENAGTGLIVVRRTGGREGSATVHYATTDGTAAAGGDYTAVSGDLTFLPGELEKTISIPIIDDTDTEGAETFTVTLSAPTGNTQLGYSASQVTTVTLGANDPPAPLVISPAPTTVTEGTLITFTVTRTSGGTIGTVNYATAPGSTPAATAGSDYTAASGTLSFAANETSKTFTVQVRFDSNSDTGEHFTVTLSNATGGLTLGGTTQSIVTITNVAPTSVSISPATLTATEGTLATLTVSRSTSATAGTVDYATANGPSPDAGNPGDYTATSGTLSFAVGELSKTISVPVNFDKENDGGEHFTVTISNRTGGLTLGATTQSTVTISNVSPTSVSISPTSISGPAGAEGSLVTFTVSRSTSTTAGTVTYATSDGTATAGSGDYTATSGTLSFAVGDLSKTFTVPVLFDSASETSEQFTVNLTDRTGGITLNTTTSTVTITNVAPTSVSISPVTTTVAEGAQPTFTVSRSTSATAGTVTYATSNGTATTGNSDYTQTSGTLSFAVGELSKTFNVPVHFDSASDPGEVFTVTLSSATGGLTLVGAITTSTVTITDVPVTPVAFSVASTTVAAVEGTVATLTVSRTTSATAGTVAYATGDVTAAASSDDYTATSGILSFAVGELSKTFDVPVLFDNLAEPDETFRVTLSNPTGGLILAATTQSTVTIIDVPPPTPVVISPAPTSVDEGTPVTLTVSRATAATAGTVAYATSNLTALAGSGDYTASSGTVSFAVGELSKTFNVPVLYDNLAEPDETFRVTLSSPTGGLILGATTQSTVTIIDLASTPVVISPAPTSGAEGATLTFTVSRTSGTTPGTVAFTTSDGAATAGSDYTTTSGIVSFAINELSKTFTVSVLSDNLADPGEAFRATIRSPTGGITLGDTTLSTITIIDVPATEIVISPASTQVTEAATQLTFNVSRATAATAGTVDYATSNGTGTGAATEGLEYAAPSPNPGTVTFAVGELSKTFNVPILDDNVYEPNENFTVTLSNPTGGLVLGATTTSTVMIYDGDADSDGLPDDYETTHGLNPAIAADALLDRDGDGLTSLQEFIMGTDPQDRTSALVLTIARTASINIQLTFPTVAGRTYTVQYRGDLTPPWETLQGGITGDGNPVTVTHINGTLLPQRFYQVLVEAPLP